MKNIKSVQSTPNALDWNNNYDKDTFSTKSWHLIDIEDNHLLKDAFDETLC